MPVLLEGVSRENVRGKLEILFYKRWLDSSRTNNNTTSNRKYTQRRK